MSHPMADDALNRLLAIRADEPRCLQLAGEGKVKVAEALQHALSASVARGGA
jgi:hypothetical protein